MSLDRIALPLRLQGHCIERLNSAWRLWLHTNDQSLGTYLLLRDDGTATRVICRADEGDSNTDEDSLSSVGGKNIADTTGGGDGSLPGKEPNTFLDAREVDDQHIKDAQNKDEVDATRKSSAEADKATAKEARAQEKDEIVKTL